MSRPGDGGRRRAHSSRPLPLRASAPPASGRHRARAAFQLPCGKSPAPLFRHPPGVSSPRRSGQRAGSSVRRDFGGSGRPARQAGRAPRGAPRHRLPPRRPAARRPRWGRAPGCGCTRLSRLTRWQWSRAGGGCSPSSITGEILPRFRPNYAANSMVFSALADAIYSVVPGHFSPRQRRPWGRSSRPPTHGRERPPSRHR